MRYVRRLLAAGKITCNDIIMNIDKYNSLIKSIFLRFPSVQTSSFGDAYKPGLQHMLDFNDLLGTPDKAFRTIHVAGTNGKGSVSNMLSSVLAGAGLKVGLYTSPHIIDFRERMRIIDGRNLAADRNETAELVPQEYVYDFLEKWQGKFDEMELSFFEITTGLAFKWFADMNVDVAVIEVGLGGRLDSTNIINPDLSVITSIGLDHCDLLGDTLDKIAFEKAGIFKRGMPVVIGETMPETEPVFRKRFAEVNASVEAVPVLVFADRTEPSMCYMHEAVLENMDLQGEYQAMNLRTVMAAIDVLQTRWHDVEGLSDKAAVADSLIHTALRMEFHGRWERLSTNPDVICDIGHNAPALTYNFGQLKEYLETGKYTSLIMVYGVMADKNFDAIMPLFPDNATWIFTTPQTARAAKASAIFEKYTAFCEESGRPASRLYVQDNVREAVLLALKTAAAYGGNPLVYIGGSTFVVSEAVPCFA